VIATYVRRPATFCDHGVSRFMLTCVRVPARNRSKTSWSRSARSRSRRRSPRLEGLTADPFPLTVRAVRPHVPASQRREHPRPRLNPGTVPAKARLPRLRVQRQRHHRHRPALIPRPHNVPVPRERALSDRVQRGGVRALSELHARHDPVQLRVEPLLPVPAGSQREGRAPPTARGGATPPSVPGSPSEAIQTLIGALLSDDVRGLRRREGRRQQDTRDTATTGRVVNRAGHGSPGGVRSASADAATPMTCANFLSCAPASPGAVIVYHADAIRPPSRTRRGTWRWRPSPQPTSSPARGGPSRRTRTAGTSPTAGSTRTSRRSS
jgi:hypothetical protein